MSATLFADPPAILAPPPCPALEAAETFVPSSDILASVPWLTRLDLRQPRRGHACLSESTRRWKRAIDVVGSIVLLILSSPLMLLAAILVRFTSRGPVIYQQERVGLNERQSARPRRAGGPADSDEESWDDGPLPDRRRTRAYGRPFILYKFRTMRVDAEKNGERFATKGDDRTTRVGRFLRKTRIDELPQLWNVLRGEMSLVGPRPERPGFVEKLTEEIPEFPKRLGMKPGLTGLAQVVNGYNNDMEGFRRKVAYDLAYLQHCCIRNDLKILLRTVKVVLTGEGAI